MSKKKFLAPLIIASLLIPQITFAVWWNPFSWGWFTSKTQKNIIAQEVVNSENGVETAKNSTSTSLVKDAVFYLSSTNPREGNIQSYDIDREAFPRDVLADETPAKIFFTSKDIATHNSQLDCLISQNNRVYNLTTLFQHTEIRTHPAVTKLQKLCGTDITKIVNESQIEPGSLNTARVRYALATLVVGRLSENLSEAKEIKIDVKNDQGTTTRAYIVAIVGNKITLDYVDFYYGEEAQKKLIEDGKCEKVEDCPMSGATSYYYRNKNPQERTLTLSQDVVIRDSRNRPQTVEYISSEGLSRLVKNEFSKNPNVEYRQGRVFIFTFNSKGEISSIKDLSIP